MQDYDVAILGGGPIGLSTGIALNGLGYRALVIERRPADVAVDDRRVLALSEGSRLILARLGVWNDLRDVTPITRIHVSDARSHGVVALSAQESGVPALGYVTTYNDLTAALVSKIQAHGALPPLHGHSARTLDVDPGRAHIALDGGEVSGLTASLVVHAEGRMQEAAGQARVKDYGQWALVAEVWIDRPSTFEAYEHFTEHGPVALLPLQDHYALVWTVPASQQAALLALDEAAFCEKLQGVLGDRAGRLLRIARPAGFPLSMRMARAVNSARTLFMGNAAQQLHPVAAQGFNLGLRDVWTLHELLWDRPTDPGDESLLTRYARQRQADRQGSVMMTDGLIGLFGSRNPILRAGRGMALQAMAMIPPLRNAFAHRMMFGSR